jgi:hypothetical protein
MTRRLAPDRNCRTSNISLDRIYDKSSKLRIGLDIASLRVASKWNEIIGDSSYFGPRDDSQFEAYPLPSSRLGSCCAPAFPRLPSRNALSVASSPSLVGITFTDTGLSYIHPCTEGLGLRFSCLHCAWQRDRSVKCKDGGRCDVTRRGRAKH